MRKGSSHADTPGNSRVPSEINNKTRSINKQENVAGMANLKYRVKEVIK